MSVLCSLLSSMHLALARPACCTIPQGVRVAQGALGWDPLTCGRVGAVRTAVTAAKHEKVRPFSEVPGPRPLPVVGNAWRFMPGIGTFDTKNFFKFGDDMHREFGDIVKISNLPGRRNMVLLFKPQHFEQIYLSEGHWPERIIFDSVKYFREKIRPDFFEGFQGLVNENGENWQKARTVVNPPMMQVKVAKQYAHKIDQVAKDFVALLPALQDDKGEMPADFNNELHKWALESIALVALDARMGCLQANLPPDAEAQRMINAVRDFFDASYELDFTVPVWRLVSTKTWRLFVAQSNAFLEISLRHVEAAQARMRDNIPEEERSVLHRILERDPSTKRAVIMAMDTMFAGIDTTSNSVAGVLYQLARNQEVQSRLYEELSSHVPYLEAPLTAETLDSMKYLKACIKEGIRLSPVTLGIARVLDTDVVIDNYLIPKNTELIMHNAHLYMQDTHFPEPARFLPERWLRGDSTACPHGSEHRAHPFTYLPFGHGPRGCVGMRFANLEMETLVARLVRRYRLEWHHPALSFTSKVLQVPADPLRFRLIDRTTN